MKPELIAKKPVSEMSDKEKKECNAIAKLIAQDWQEKGFLSDLFNMNERTVRDRISTISKVKPVISISSRKGYKWATNPNEIELVKQTRAEILSRINELSAKLKPLENFILEHEREYSNGND